ncbi:6-phosphofructokinase [Undibacterium flavidum]|uniref:ATP-dependent 6-phosphofructokinase n=1 Tax=Undibacterium flavidum TaxID=2762297 RepID=A0ABR6YDP0_9BURK|nr:ATP-dependent 6-phosphofructokinase [Undibacterium flavidum]MBC3874675.1 ATP-dependent 6-phosphofructokinase [Undibacterium flavidum]
MTSPLNQSTPSQPIRRVAISTGGGDAPGLNAVIRAVVLSALQRGWECFGIREGFNGILRPDRFPVDGVFALNKDHVRGINHLGGTILGTTNHGNPMRFVVTQPDGSQAEIDRTGDIISHLRAMQIDALICIGGDGTLTIAHALHQQGYAQGLRVIGVPKTIDNDLDKTYTTFGFDTAVAFATDCIDRLHSTAESHRRIMVVEVMGRYAGWIALHAGMASTAHAILIPEIAYDVEKIAQKIQARTQAGRHYSIVVVAEGAQPKDGQRYLEEQAQLGGVERLGGIGEQLAHQLEAITGKEARAVVLGHLLRGGSPTSFDRLSAMRFGAAAVRALKEGYSGIMVALAFPNVNYVNLDEVAGRMKGVPLDGDTLQTGRDIGICFGD